MSWERQDSASLGVLARTAAPCRARQQRRSRSPRATQHSTASCKEAQLQASKPGRATPRFFYHRVSPYARRERSTSRAGVAAAVTGDRVWAARRDRYRRQRSETGSSRPTARSRVGRAGHAAPARRQTERGARDRRGQRGRVREQRGENTGTTWERAGADGEHRATDRPVRDLRGQSDWSVANPNRRSPAIRWIRGRVRFGWLA